jgi:hypothetical protein
LYSFKAICQVIRLTFIIQSSTIKTMRNAREVSLRPEDGEKNEVLQDGTQIIIEVLESWKEHEEVGRGEEGTREEDTAAHEAEHAVIAIVNGVPVEIATIEPEESNGQATLGHVITGAVKDPEVDAMISATSHGRIGNSGDKRYVEALLGEGSFEKIGERAHAEIQRNKKKVRRVAAALLKEKKLTGAKIEQIMNQPDESDTENVRVTVIRPGAKEAMVLERAVKKGDVIDLSMLAPADLPRESDHQLFDEEEDFGDARIAA